MDSFVGGDVLQTVLAVSGAWSADLVRHALLYVMLLVASVSLHEAAHAYAAYWLGDPTPESEERLTLNPLAHIDPIGTLIAPLVLALSGTGVAFGWGRPVNTQPRFYTRKITQRAGMALVAFAGPLSNLVQAGLTIGVVAILGATGVIASPPYLAQAFLSMNLVLFCFNLLPIHPLDGGKVLAWALPPSLEYVNEFLSEYGTYVVIGLMLLGGPLLGALFRPILSVGYLLLDYVV